jgi:uncharacterized protein YndB with AHSA1/START domain
MDFKVGGVWKHVMRGPDGAEYPNSSVFEEILEPRRIVYSHGGGRIGGPSVQFRATWTFDSVDSGSKTKVTIHQVFASAAERAKVALEFGAIKGGRQTLERLREYLSHAGKT